MNTFSEIFDNNPDLEVLYCTSDGLPFKNQSSANWHQGRIGDGRVTLVTRPEASTQEPATTEVTLTVAELREKLVALGIEAPAKTKKADLEIMLLKAQDVTEEIAKVETETGGEDPEVAETVTEETEQQKEESTELKTETGSEDPEITT